MKMNEAWFDLIKQSVCDSVKDMQDALWESQIEEYPESVRMPIQEVFAWCAEAKTGTTSQYRYAQISMALQFPVVVFYRIEGTSYRGFRFGIDGSQYFSLYSDC